MQSVVSKPDTFNKMTVIFQIVKTAIMEVVGPERCDVVFNLVPKQYAMSDIYCQLIPNDDDKDPYY